LANIKRKESQSAEMQRGMIQFMHGYNEKNIKGLERSVSHYLPQEKLIIPKWLTGAV